MNSLLQQVWKGRSSEIKELAHSLHFSHGVNYAQYSRGGPFPRTYYEGARVALLVRDPRDLLVSGFYYQKFQFDRFEGSLHDHLHYRADSPQPHLGDLKARARHFAFGLDPIIARPGKKQ